MEYHTKVKKKRKYLLLLGLGILLFLSGIFLVIIDTINVGWLSVIVLISSLLIILISLYKLQDLSIHVPQPEDRNDPAKLEENIKKYFLQEKFHSLPGFDITMMKLDGQTQTNQELGLVKGHVFDNLLIIVLKIHNGEQKERFIDLIEDNPNFSINQNLISEPQDLHSDNHILTNFVIKYTHSHNFNLLDDLNQILKQLEGIEA